MMRVIKLYKINKEMWDIENEVGICNKIKVIFELVLKCSDHVFRGLGVKTISL